MTTKPGTLVFIVLALTVVSLVPAGPAPAQDQPLAWKFAAGDVYQVQLTQSSNSRSVVDSRRTEIESKTTLRLAWQVLQVDEQGTAQLEQTLEAVQVSVGDPEVPGQTVAYDTEGEPEADKTSRQLRQQVQPLIGLKVRLTMTAQGKFVSASIPDATQQAILDLPGAVKLKNLFDAAGIEELLGGTTVVLPDDAGPGSEWTDASDIETPLGSLQRSRHFAIGQPQARGDRQQAEIRITSQVTPNGTVAAADGNPASRLVSFTGGGSLWFDVEGGHCSEARLKHSSVAERQYREKTIRTTVDDELEMLVTKKK